MVYNKMKISGLLLVLIIFLSHVLYAQDNEEAALLGVNGSTELMIPLYEPLIFSITGTAAGNVAIQNLSPELFDINANEISNSIIIKGLNIGQGTFVMQRGKIRRVIYVSVKEAAAVIPQKIKLTITGNPASREFLREAALRAVLAKTTLKPHSYLLFDEYVPFDGPATLGKGEVKTFKLPVKVESLNYFPVRTTVDIEVSNIPVPAEETSLLMLSNRPEKIEEDGILFQETINPHKPVRLLFYHQNSPESSEREFLLKLSNPSSETVDVKLISGFSGPNIDVFYVGHKSSERFLVDYASDSGQIISIPPKGEIFLFKSLMKSGEVVAGLAEISISGKSPVIATVQAGQPDIAYNSQETVPDDFNPFRIHPKGVFANPNITGEYSYKVGDNELSIPIGVSPWLLDLETGAPNQGNYGAVYKFNIFLSNYTEETKSVRFYFVPINGVARGVFVINGNLYTSELVRPGHTSLITEISLSPKERKFLKVYSTPQSGSNYPVQLLIK